MYCSQCGKKLPDGVTVCECRSQEPQPPVTPVVAPEGETVPVAQPALVAPETPVVNGAPVVGAVPVAVPDVDCDREFLEVIKSCKLINILGIVLFVTGLVSLIFINGWVAAVIFLVGELFVLMPNTKVQKICKAKNPTADKKSLQKITKETVKRLKSKDKNFKFSFIIAIVCLACLVLSFVVPAPLVGAGNSSVDDIEVSEDMGSTIDYDDDKSNHRYEKVEATSFITKNNFEIYETIKPYCKQIGYDVDSWIVHTNTEKSLLLLGPQNSTEGQMVMVSDSNIVVQMKKNFLVTGDGNDGLIIITGKEKAYVFGFVDAIFDECPDEYKYTGQYLMDNHETNVVNGSSRFEKEGVEYQITYLPQNGTWHITLRLA